MRHDDAIYLHWLKAESRCRAISHQLYMLMNAGGRPSECLFGSLLDEFSRAIEDAHAGSSCYLKHLRELAHNAA